MSRSFFAEIVEALIGFLPAGYESISSRVTSGHVKVWCGAEAREHYEVQLLRRDGVTCLEIGFHTEHPDAGRNDEILARLLETEHRWRPSLGDDVEVGAFLGGGGSWRRASEVWDDLDVAEPGAAIEAADRLATYITAFEPLLHGP